MLKIKRFLQRLSLACKAFELRLDIAEKTKIYENATAPLARLGLDMLLKSLHTELEAVEAEYRATFQSGSNRPQAI